MAGFFAELRRRQMFRVAAAYAVVAWLLLQVFNNLTPVMRLPDWAGTLVIVLLVGGFPVALLFCWIQHLAPADGVPPPARTAKLDWLLIGALVLVIALISYQQLAPSPGGGTAQQQQTGVISIAVLPLANLSGDTAQEFFSDGMTDEITSALAKVRDLRVVGRSSAFQFKGQNRDLRAIGEALSARYLIDGSVRKAGTRVRITAQLIEAANGVNVWTENYDRELTDIFAIQEDIATAIAGALRVPLGLGQGESLVSNQKIDSESYEQYLHAKTVVRARTGVGSLTEAAALLEPVVTRNPDYAPAWALLAQAYGLMPAFHPALARGDTEEARRVVDGSIQKSQAAARRAIQLDAKLADGYVSLSFTQSGQGQSLLAEEGFLKALALDPNNPDALHHYSQTLAKVGYVREALAMRQSLRALEPFVPIFNSNTAVMLWLNGQNDAAIEILKASPPDTRLAQIYASMGRYSEAADVSQAVSSVSDVFPSDTMQEAVRLLRTAPRAAASPQTLPRLGGLGFVYLYVGAEDRVLEVDEADLEAGYVATVTTARLWHPSYAPVRKTERFKALMRNVGAVEFWRARGWTDLCRPVGVDDFVCD
jgi:TolB-like protein/Tfp pilus assembly protein PilF